MRAPMMIAFAAVASLAAPASSQCVEERIVNPPDALGSFGSSTSLDGDTLAVGQTVIGIVSIYDRQEPDWALVQQIDAVPGYSGLQFGGEVALRGDTLLIAATGGTGAVFVYERVNGVFELEEQLETSFELIWGMKFGDTIVLDDDGNEAIIAAPDAGNLSVEGRFFHFRKQSAGWIEKQVVHPAFDNQSNVSLFSWSVLYDAPLLFIGNQRSDGPGDSKGEVFVYEHTSGVGFTKIQELRDETPDSFFGVSLAKRGNQVAVGATKSSSSDHSGGAVVLFEDDGSGFSQVERVDPGLDDANSDFGRNLAYHGNKLLIGSTRGGLAGTQSNLGGVVRVYQVVDDEWRYVARVGPDEHAVWVVDQGFSQSGSELAVSSTATHFTPSTIWVLDLEGGAMNLFCEAGANSVGDGARISGKGFPAVSDNVFSLVVEGAPSNQFGKFYYGPEPASVPFGNGTGCVGAGSTGIFRLTPSATTDLDGSFVRRLDFTELPASAGPGQILPGSTWYFQYWYRDPQGGGAAFNLSDGLEVSFCP